jgi:hypothetical protein
MDSLALVFMEVVIERVDEMEKVIKHPRPLQAGSLSASPYVRQNKSLIMKFRARDVSGH